MHPDFAARRERERLLGVEVVGVRDGDVEIRIGGAKRNDAIPLRDALTDQFLDAGIAEREVGDLEAGPFRQRLEQLVVGDLRLVRGKIPERGIRLSDRPQLSHGLGGQQRRDGRDQPFVGENAVCH